MKTEDSHSYEWWKYSSGRQWLEDAAALAFTELSPELQSELLSAQLEIVR